MSLSCTFNLHDVTVTWTRGSTQLASAPSTSSLIHTINNIMRNDSGIYTCTVVDTIGTNAFQITRQSSVIVKVLCECIFKYKFSYNQTCICCLYIVSTVYMYAIKMPNLYYYLTKKHTMLVLYIMLHNKRHLHHYINKLVMHVFNSMIQLHFSTHLQYALYIPLYSW